MKFLNIWNYLVAQIFISDISLPTVPQQLPHPADSRDMQSGFKVARIQCDSRDHVYCNVYITPE